MPTGKCCVICHDSSQYHGTWGLSGATSHAGFTEGACCINNVTSVKFQLFDSSVQTLKELIWTLFAAVFLNFYKKANHHSLCVCGKICDEFEKEKHPRLFWFCRVSVYSWINKPICNSFKVSTRQITVLDLELISSLKRCLYVYSPILLLIVCVAFFISQPPEGTVGQIGPFSFILCVCWKANTNRHPLCLLRFFA